MNARQLWFTKPFQVEIREQRLAPPGPGEILVRNLYSGISAGTEMLLYRGQVPDTMVLDESLASFAGRQITYPLQYGYACVGRVEEAGEEVDASWVGTTVFSFQPHATYHLCTPADVVPVPGYLEPAAAVFLANMETAVNLLLDGNPPLGGRAVVLGQGIVGLLTSSLLTGFPLEQLYTVEPAAGRRLIAERAGVHAVYDPHCESDITALKKLLRPEEPSGGADVIFELSGSPEALNLAIDLCGFSGRIVIGSWYGMKTAPLNLGERFHRNRMEIVSSQVSTIAPRLRGRWDKSRRFALAWSMIKQCHPEQFITHRMPFSSAPDAYRLLDESPNDVLQVVFTYE